MLILCLLLLGGAIALYFYVKGFTPRARQRVIQALAERFDADVDLNSLDISLFPEPKAIGEGLSIRHKGWNDPHPLIYIRRFTAQTDFYTLLDGRNRVNLVRLEGLELHVPPRGRSALIEETKENHEIASAEPGEDTTRLRFLIQTVIADGALLEIEPKKTGKPPLRYNIQKLTLRSVGPGEPMAFEAALTNAKPPGRIDSSGRFGPWQRDDPRATAVSGSYTFANADLSVFRGISGTLSSKGSYRGVLQHIEVDGVTDTPQFALKRGGEPVHLTTQFHSIVNGTDGETILEPVDARFLHSEFICRGGIIYEPAAQNGKTVSLDAVTNHGRIEDVLHLVLGTGKVPLTGAVDFKTKIVIPPGSADVLNKLQLDGQFGILSAEFTSSNMQQHLDTLSERAQGISKKQDASESPETVASNFRGRFKLDHGLASFSQLSFDIPGAAVNLTGTYDLRSEQIKMDGTFRMEATLSQTQAGVKHWLLKPFDRFFEKNGAGFMLPVHITGTKDHPEIGTEVFHRKVTLH